MAVIYASCDVKDTDWWVRLEDIDETGRAMSLNLGTIKARFASWKIPGLMSLAPTLRNRISLRQPRDIVRYEISMAGMAITLKRDTASWWQYDAYDNYRFPNPNTGGDEALATLTVPVK